MKSVSQILLLYCNQSMGMGGAEVFLTDLLKTVPAQKWSVQVATTSGALASQMRAVGMTVQQLPWVMDVIGDWKGLVKAVIFGPLAAWQWWRVLQRHQGVVLLSGFNEKLLVTPLAARLGLPVVWIEFSSLAPVLSMWGGLIGAWYRRLLPQVSTIVTSSEFSRQKLQKELKLEQKKIVVIPCGSSATLKPIAKKKAQKIVCVSRLQPGKGQDLLLQSFAQVVTQHPTAELVIVGEGDFLPALKQQVAALALDGKVTFTGWVERADEMWRQAAISVFPSMWELEGFGLVMIEAMAAGVPIVTFDRGPMNEVVLHQRNGLLAESGSVDDLAQKISWLLTSPTEAKKLATQAQRDFARLYTIDRIADQYAAHLSHYYR
jgi:glycosyltransferase involved in cell wall biosynthesis